MKKWLEYHAPYWLVPEWWSYVLDDSDADDDYGPFNSTFRWTWRDEYVTNHVGRWLNYLSRCKCRATGHPCGVYFYNAGGMEPDMRCRGCGEDLG